jgi:hypothetical protein
VGRYDALRERLQHDHDRELTLHFDEIDEIVGGLPPSAHNHRAWWSNAPAGHSHAAAWLRAGRRVLDVNLTAGRVRFSAATDAGAQAPGMEPAADAPDDVRATTVPWHDVWPEVATTMRDHVDQGLRHLLTEDVVRFATIRALVRAGIESHRLTVEHRRPEIAASLDLVVDASTSLMAAVELKYPRDSEPAGAPYTMTLGELLRDLYRLAWVELHDSWAL